MNVKTCDLEAFFLFLFARFSQIAGRGWPDDVAFERVAAIVALDVVVI